MNTNFYTSVGSFTRAQRVAGARSVGHKLAIGVGITAAPFVGFAAPRALDKATGWYSSPGKWDGDQKEVNSGVRSWAKGGTVLAFGVGGAAAFFAARPGGPLSIAGALFGAAGVIGTWSHPVQPLTPELREHVSTGR